MRVQGDTKWLKITTPPQYTLYGIFEQTFQGYHMVPQKWKSLINGSSVDVSTNVMVGTRLNVCQQSIMVRTVLVLVYVQLT